MNDDVKATNQLLHQWWGVPLAIGCLIGVLWVLVTGQFRPITTIDIDQHRVNTAAPIPNDNQVLRQTFTPTRDGLYEVELLVVRYGDPDPDDEGELILELLDENGEQVARDVLPTKQLEHNQTYALRFEVQEDSAEKTYTLILSGENNTAITAWGYGLDVLADGKLISAEPAPLPPDLRLVTRYQLTLQSALNTLWNQLTTNAILLIAPFLILPLPALLILQLRPKNSPLSQEATLRYTILHSPFSFLLSLALGTALWPILWLWTSVSGWQWEQWSLWVVVIGGWILLLIRAIRNKKQVTINSQQVTVNVHFLLLIVIYLAGLITRLLAVRDLAFPAWVDASRHALITQKMVESGQFLNDYRPYLDIGDVLYHYGFHTLAATLTLMLGGDLANNLLIFGQWLNALIPLTIYAATWQLTRRRGAALLAAFLVALPFFFPAYYVSWGRMTQLTGMVILPILLSLTWRLGQGVRRSGGQEVRRLGDWWGLVGIGLLAGGLFLVHFRVFLLYVPFALVVGVVFWRRIVPLLLAGGVAFVAVLPRIIQLARITQPDSVLTPIAGYNAFPSGYISVGWERAFLFAVGAGLLLMILGMMTRSPWVNLSVLVGLIVFGGVGEWLGRIPPLLNTPFLRTALMGALFVPTLRWRWHIQRWRIQLPLTFLIWLVLGAYLDSIEHHLITLTAIALITTIASEHITEYRILNTELPTTALTIWVALLFLSLFGRTLNLPETWVINLNSMYITLFLPVSMVLGMVTMLVWDWLHDRQWIVQTIGYLVVGFLIGWATLFGIRNQITILNESTVLAKRADVAGLRWLGENVPDDANVAVSAWLWLGSTWAAQDGGAWILPLTGQRVTTPPADYSYSRELSERVQAFNVSAETIEDWSTPEAAQFLHENAITHIYIGARGGYLEPAQLDSNPATELSYAHDGVFIFRVLSESP